MAKHTTWKATRYATRCAANAAEKAITSLGRWAVTDHTGVTKRLANLPQMGFVDTLSMILVTVVCGVLGAAVSGALFVLLIAYCVPVLFGL